MTLPTAATLTLAGAVLAAATAAFRHERRDGVALAVAAHLAPDARVKEAMLEWLAPDAQRGTGCFVSLFLLVASVALAVKAFGPGGLWLAVVGLFLVAIGGAVGTKAGATRGPVAEDLTRLAARASEVTARFSASGDTERAGLAQAVVTHVRRLLEWQPQLTAKQLAGYHTPVQVAACLTEALLPDPEAMPEDLEETALASWLACADQPLADHPDEISRCELLDRTRDELLRGGGVKFADMDRVREMIAELRAWMPPA